MRWALYLCLIAVVVATPITFIDGVLEVDEKYIEASALLQQGVNNSEIVPYGIDEFLWLVDMVEHEQYSKEVERVLTQYEMWNIIGSYAGYLLVHSPLLDYGDELAVYVDEMMRVYYPNMMLMMLELRRSGCMYGAMGLIIKNTTVITGLVPQPCTKILALPVPPPPNMPVYVPNPQYGNSAEANAYNQAISSYLQRLLSMVRDYVQLQGWEQTRISLSATYDKENYYAWLSFTLYPPRCRTYGDGNVCG